MILSFRHNGLKLLYQKGDRRKVQPEHADKIERILARLEEASAAGNMDLPASGCTRSRVILLVFGRLRCPETGVLSFNSKAATPAMWI